uniref:UPF0291 protein MCCL_0996 n=1 Tax=Anthurium amnicola TaxID=1678845 RepID=A0A1D1Y6C6_9ARAE
MNRNFIFAFTLLAIIFMVNAAPQRLSRRETVTFNDCPIKGASTLTVAIVPNPIVASSVASFTVTGILGSDVTAGETKLAVGFADESGQKLLEEVYYQTFTTSFKAGDKVTIEASSVTTPVLPSVYTVGVAIGDPKVGSPFVPLDIFGCAYAVVGDSSKASFPFDTISGAST